MLVPPCALKLFNADRVLEERLECLLKLSAECTVVSPSPVGMAEAFKDLHSGQLWLVLFQ